MTGLGKSSCSSVQKCVLLIFLLLVAVHVIGQELVSKENCDKTKCPGPLRHYKGLGCTPIYANPNDCCAKAYECSHLDNLSPNKCYVNGHEYNIGQMLKPEDSNRCDLNCTCTHYDDGAGFNCSGVEYCLQEQSCLERKMRGLCCRDPTCDLTEIEKQVCNVDGEVYQGGETFSPKSNPKLECYCMPGYTGENIEPFCEELKRETCSPLFEQAAQIRQKCAPVYYFQDPHDSCAFVYRCPVESDIVVQKERVTSDSKKGNKTCQYGNLTLNIGDELNQVQTDIFSANVKCVCEVPPIVTCQRKQEATQLSSKERF
ncbi:putative epidermal cell surface receptor isoform X1 [Frieseomelitta varia]|uniref:putative epidermal cell surface receptor isoform X1 n=1 Tax=Frieseomelitta varia TaxID=561572 RepID=UPI001CB67B41|nr:putative epidermal cell surface receptor isoform X1 [Frieseomelitta varia]